MNSRDGSAKGCSNGGDNNQPNTILPAPFKSSEDVQAGEGPNGTGGPAQNDPGGNKAAPLPASGAAMARQRKSARSRSAHKKTFIVPDDAIRGLPYVYGLMPFLPDDQVKAIKDEWFESNFGPKGRYLKAAWAAENFAAAVPTQAQKKEERVEIVRPACEAYWTKHGRRNSAQTALHLLSGVNKTLKQAKHPPYTIESFEKLVREIMGKATSGKTTSSPK
jgi:hypothetical protein